VETIAAALSDFRSLRRQSGLQLRLIGGGAVRRYRPCPIRIVEIEHLGLRESVCSAEARWMPRIAFYLDRPAHLVLDHDAGRVSV
jgi:hypothetical protein